MLVSKLNDVIAKGKGIPQFTIAIIPNHNHSSTLLIVLFQQSNNLEKLMLFQGNFPIGRDFGEFIGFDRDGDVSVFVNVLHATHSIHFRMLSIGLEHNFAWHTIWVGKFCKCLISKDLG